MLFHNMLLLNKILLLHNILLFHNILILNEILLLHNILLPHNILIRYKILLLNKILLLHNTNYSVLLDSAPTALTDWRQSCLIKTFSPNVYQCVNVRVQSYGSSLCMCCRSDLMIKNVTTMSSHRYVYYICRILYKY